MSNQRSKLCEISGDPIELASLIMSQILSLPNRFEQDTTLAQWLARIDSAEEGLRWVRNRAFSDKRYFDSATG